MAGTRAEGFTLVEILVAFTIALLVLPPLLHGFSGALGSAAGSEAYEQATAIAESALDALGSDAPLADGQGYELRDGRFTVRATVRRQPFGDASGYVIPYDLSVVVSWREGPRTRHVALETLRLGPQR